MKNKILAGVCLLGMFAAAGTTGGWPDGSAMDAWFADKSPVDEAKLGRQYFSSQMLGGKANVPELQTKPLQMTIDWIASQGGGVLVLGLGVWNTSSLWATPSTARSWRSTTCAHTEPQVHSRDLWMNYSFGCCGVSKMGILRASKMGNPARH